MVLVFIIESSIEYRLSIEEGKRYQPYYREMSDKSQLAVWCIENNKEVFINDIEKEFSTYLKDIDLTVLKSAALEDGSIPKSLYREFIFHCRLRIKLSGLFRFSRLVKMPIQNTIWIF